MGTFNIMYLAFNSILTYWLYSNLSKYLKCIITDMVESKHTDNQYTLKQLFILPQMQSAFYMNLSHSHT